MKMYANKLLNRTHTKIPLSCCYTIVNAQNSKYIIICLENSSYQKVCFRMIHFFFCNFKNFLCLRFGYSKKKIVLILKYIKIKINRGTFCFPFKI